MKPMHHFVLKNFKGTAKQKELTYKALMHAEITINSVLFKESLLLNHKKFTQREIPTLSLDAIIKPDEDSFYHADITWYYKRWTTVVGYRLVGTNKTFINAAKIIRLDHVAGNIVHEWLHILGYDHSYKNPDKEFGINYWIGGYVQDWIKSVFNFKDTNARKPWWKRWF